MIFQDLEYCDGEDGEDGDVETCRCLLENAGTRLGNHSVVEVDTGSVEADTVGNS